MRLPSLRISQKKERGILANLQTQRISIRINKSCD